MKFKTPTLRLYHEMKSVNKRQLATLTKKRLKQINKNHVDSVINILFDLLNEEIVTNKSINIGNFLEFKLVRMPAKKSMNYYTGEMGMCKAYNKMFVSLNRKLANYLLKEIEIDKYVPPEKKK